VNRGVLLMLLAGGLGLAYLVYDWMQYRMRRRRSREVQETGMAAKVSYDWKVYMMIAMALLLAFLYGRNITRFVGDPVDNVTKNTHAYIVAVYVIVVGVWWAIRQARKEARSQRALIGDQVTELVAAFKSVFRIRPTVFSALEEANKKIPAPTGAAVAHAVTTFYVTSLPRRARLSPGPSPSNPCASTLRSAPCAWPTPRGGSPQTACAFFISLIRTSRGGRRANARRSNASAG